MSNTPLFQPSKVLWAPNHELIKETNIVVTDSLKKYEKDYAFFFVNTMHMYIRIPVSLLELYAKQFNRPVTVTNFELPEPILTENVEFPKDTKPPEPGWSRYIQGMPHAEYKLFIDWIINTKWLSCLKDNGRILFECCRETVQVRDPVKLQLQKFVDIKDFVNIDFYLPASLGSRLFLNTKNGPPFTCVYTVRSSPSNGDLSDLTEKLKNEISD